MNMNELTQVQATSNEHNADVVMMVLEDDCIVYVESDDIVITL